MANHSPSEPFDSTLPPVQIGPYALYSKLGSGGMGTVYLARHTLLDEFYVIKLLKPQHKGDERVIERFKREMLAVGRLKHPHIIRASNAGEEDGCHYLVMEFVPGVDLGRIIRGHAPFTYPDACEITRQTAEALACIAEKEMVHRDIKPSNLLLGNDGLVRVLDLGLVRIRPEPMDEEPLTETCQIMGTGDFIAPVQGTRTRDVDIRADIYSLGCTLYAMLTGSPPFVGIATGDFHGKIQTHRNVPVPSITARRPDLPAGLVELLGKMLEKDPNARISSPRVLADALVPFTHGHHLRELIGKINGEETVSQSPAPTPPIQPLVDESRDQRFSSTAPYVPRTSPPPRKRYRRWWMFAPMLGLIGLMGYLASQQGSEPVAALIPANDPIRSPWKIGEWNDLLVKEPTVRLWPEDTEGSFHHFDRDKGQIATQCAGVGMLEFADVDDIPYEFEMSLRQTIWIGGVGIFFRHHPDGMKGNMAVVSDVIQYEIFRGMKPNGTVRLERGQGILYRINKRPMIEWMAADKVPEPAGLVRLKIRVTKVGLEDIRINDVSVAPRLIDPTQLVYQRPSPRGGVGISLRAASAVVISARIRPLTTPEAPRE